MNVFSPPAFSRRNCKKPHRDVSSDEEQIVSRDSYSYPRLSNNALFLILPIILFTSIYRISVFPYFNWSRNSMDPRFFNTSRNEEYVFSRLLAFLYLEIF